MKSSYVYLAMVAVVCSLSTSAVAQQPQPLAAATPAANQPGHASINGLIYLINTDPEAEIDGLLKWEGELKSRGLTAMIKASNAVLETYPEVFKRLAGEGHEIIGGYPGI